MRFFTILSTLILFYGVLFAVEIKLPQEKALQGQKYTIVIKAEGKDISFEPIKKIGGYEIIEKNEVINTIFINKDIAYQKRLVVTIIPQKSFTIEPIEVVVDGKKQKTQELFVDVEKPKDLTKGKYFIKLFADKKSVYLNEPLQVTMRLFELKEQRLLELLYSPPSKENFFVKQKGEERSYEQDKFIVHEINYIYYPQKVGQLSIKGASARIGVPVKAEDMFGQTYVPKQQMIYSKNLEIDVKDLNESVELVGNVGFTQTVSGQKVEANEPVFIDLKLQGAANFYDFKGFELFLEDATVYEGKTKITPTSFEQGFSVVANKNFTLPKLQVRVFDTKEQSVKVLENEALTIEVSQALEKKPQIKVVQKEVLDIKMMFITFLFGLITAALVIFAFSRVKYTKTAKEKKLQQFLKGCDDPYIYAKLKRLYLLETKGKLTQQESKEYKKLLHELKQKG